MGKEEEEPTFEELLEQLTSEESILKRYSIAEKLAKRENKSVIEFCADLFKTENWQNHEAAIMLLNNPSLKINAEQDEKVKARREEIASSFEQELRNAAEDIQELAKTVILEPTWIATKMTEDEYNILLLLPKLEKEDSKVKISTINKLNTLLLRPIHVLLATRVSPKLISLLQDSDDEVRKCVVESIRSTGIHLAYLFQSIFEIESDEGHWDWRGFDDYICYLNKLLEGCELPALIEMPTTDEEMETTVKETAKLILNVLKNEQTFDLMITELKDENKYRREAWGMQQLVGVAWILGELGDKRAIKPLELAFQQAYFSKIEALGNNLWNVILDALGTL